MGHEAGLEVATATENNTHARKNITRALFVEVLHRRAHERGLNACILGSRLSVFMHMLAGRGVFSCLSVYMATYVLIFLFRFECQEAQIPICTTAVKHVNL